MGRELGLQSTAMAVFTRQLELELRRRGLEPFAQVIDLVPHRDEQRLEAFDGKAEIGVHAPS